MTGPLDVAPTPGRDAPVAGLVLRPARPLDAGAMGGILSDFIDMTPWMPRVHSRAEEIGFADRLIEEGWTTVAVDAAGVAGFLSREADEVHALYLRGDARGQGIGTVLLAQAKAVRDRLTLWCFQANTSAQGFYRAQGFAELRRTNGARNDEGLPDLRLVWDRRRHG